MNRSLMIGVVVVIVLAGVGWFLLKDQIMPQVSQTQTIDQTVAPSDSQAVQASPAGVIESTDSAIGGQVKEFTITASNFKFDTSEIRVKEGDTVKITFKNAGGFHDFVIDEFNVKAKQGNGPSQQVLTFKADKAGVYAFYCSVLQHRANGMEGKLIVE